MSPLPSAAMSFSPWEMFLNAGPVVRMVMSLLAFASVLSWTVFLAKSVEFFRLRRRLDRDARSLAEAASLQIAEERSRATRSVAHMFVAAAEDERIRSHDIPDDHDGLKERIVLHLERLEAAEGRKLMRGTGL
ncbi:tonB-system energizer ExbB, partial [Gluconacetobacter liquefaciens]|nr:tonB-system energizer ExbB [Gluconacetobacter liquefaciens]